MNVLCVLEFILFYMCLGVYICVYTIVQLFMDPKDSLESHSSVPISFKIFFFFEMDFHCSGSYLIS